MFRNGFSGQSQNRLFIKDWYLIIIIIGQMILKMVAIIKHNCRNNQSSLKIYQIILNYLKSSTNLQLQLKRKKELKKNKSNRKLMLSFQKMFRLNSLTLRIKKLKIDGLGILVPWVLMLYENRLKLRYLSLDQGLWDQKLPKIQ